ncbi:MAG: hypothetical protein IH802_06780 [Nitrospinae bacterium]|nr:hypothetical protein [Nitrospinota bacterium]
MKECQYCISSCRSEDKFEKLIRLTRVENCTCLQGIPFYLKDGSAPDGQIKLRGQDLTQDQSRWIHWFIEISRYLNPHISRNPFPYLPDCIITITLEGGIIKHLTLEYEEEWFMYEALSEEDKQDFQDWIEAHENGGL